MDRRSDRKVAEDLTALYKEAGCRGEGAVLPPDWEKDGYYVKQQAGTTVTGTCR